MPDPGFAVTDIQGSTALWERLGPAFAPVLAEHNRIVRAAIAACGGDELRTEGDSFSAAFPDAGAAVRFALRLLEDLHRHNWPAETGELLVRVGIHAGPAKRETGEGGRPRYSGNAPALAAAVAAAAHGGQALATGEALAGAALPGAETADLGEHRFDAAAAPVRLFQVLPSSLVSRTFPPPRTESALRTNLARETNAFIGREAELRELAGLIPTPAGRLVTLTGPGGIGKTRLAARAAAELLPRFPGGAWVVDLSEARSPSDVARAAAAALGIPLAGRDDPARAVGAALEFRKPLLLILESFEAAAAHAAVTVGAWTRSARDARFLVTSRSLLHLSGERELALGPLPAPPRASREGTRRRAAADLPGFDAVKLFLVRASEHAPAFVLDAANAVAVGDICARLEGIPLALELAAARLRDHAPSQILEQLEKRIGSLEAAPGDTNARRQTLSGALAWTYGELSEWEKSAFRQACVFHGGFFLEAAEAVVELSEFPDAPLAIDAIQGLRDRSLVRTWDTPFGTRFGMYGPVREFGEAQAGAAPGELDGAAGRHAAHFASYGDAWRRRLSEADGMEALKRLGLEEENLLRAASWGRSSPAGREAAARATLAWAEVATNRGPYTDVAPACEAAAASLASPSALRTVLFRSASRGEFYGGTVSAAAAQAEKSLQEALAVGEDRDISISQTWLARILSVGGDQKRALALFNEAESIARRSGDILSLCNAIGMRGTLYHELRDLAGQERDFEEAVRLSRQLGHPLVLARHLHNHATVYRWRSEYKPALAEFDEAARIFREAGNIADVGSVDVNRSVILFETGDKAGARECLLRAIDSFRFVGFRQQLILAISNLAALESLEGKPESGLPHAEEALRIARGFDSPHILLSAIIMTGEILHGVGRSEEALALLLEGVDLSRSKSLVRDVPRLATVAGAVLIALGKFDQARPIVEEGLRSITHAAEDSFEAFALRIQLGEIEVAAGRPEEARKLANEAFGIAETLPPGAKRRLEGEPDLMETAKKLAGRA